MQILMRRGSVGNGVTQMLKVEVNDTVIVNSRSVDSYHDITAKKVSLRSDLPPLRVAEIIIKAVAKQSNAIPIISQTQ